MADKNQKLPKPPFSNNGNSVELLQMLCELAYAQINNQTFLSKEVVTVPVSGGSPVNLTVPEGATRAYIKVEMNAASTAEICLRYEKDGSTVTGTTGMPLGHLSEIELFNGAELAAIEFISVDANEQTLHVEYYQ